MNKIKQYLFPQRGKEKLFFRLFIVLVYTGLLFGIVISTIGYLQDVKVQNTLNAKEIQTQLGWSLMDPSITSSTVRSFLDAEIYNLENGLYEGDINKYYNHLKFDQIPGLASKVYEETGNFQKKENILKVKDILDLRINEYREARWENFNPYTMFDEFLMSIILIVVPIFIFFRAIVYRILLYIIFGKKIIKI